MRRKRLLRAVFAVPLCLYFSVITGQTASFNIPDTVCINTPVNITNTSTGASSYYWNFCVADINKPPTTLNMGNIGTFNQPVFMDYAFFNNNYYGFVTNYNTGRLIRLNFGNSLLNTPTYTDLGNFGGILPTGVGSEGIQLVFNEGKWYAIIVAGYTPSGSSPRIVRISFGANLANPAPTATDWGNLGNMYQPIDLHVFQENNNWYGFTVNAENNTITRFDFTNSFENTPTATNLGNIGSLSYPTGIYAINDNGYWRVFIVNGGNNTSTSGVFSLTRLDFGNSLLNTPTGINLGSLGNVLQHPRDITIMKSCGQIIGFSVNGHPGYNDIVKLDFKGDLSSTPAAVSLGNTGGFSFPHSISKLFRVNEDLYSFVTNAGNNTITRLRFTGCNNASIPNSIAQTPPPITYNMPGTYNINLTIDDGLPTQNAFCKQVTVVAAPVHMPTQSVIRCENENKRIGTGTKSATYLWSTGATSDSIDVTINGLYWVDISRFGCTTRDSIIVNSETADFSFEQDACNPLAVKFTNETPNIVSATWSFGNGNTGTGSPVNTLFTAFNDYTVQLTAKSSSGCAVSVTKQIPIHVLTDSLIITNDTTICYGTSKQLLALPALSYCWTPATNLSNTSIANPVASPLQTTTYYVTTKTPGTNLIVNGDFSAGNTGFTSDYKYVPPPSVLQGEYFVGPDPRAWNINLYSCRDHTTGNGNMLLVNGAPDLDVRIWEQTVSVTPNTNYIFSTWIQSIHVASPAQLQFSINGKNLGNTINASATACSWSQFYTTWNSGNNTTATIAIVNRNTAITGNDFALDDISFAPVTIKRDSVVITVDKPSVTISNNDTAICPGSSVQLNATGAATYLWTPTLGLSASDISNPVATPTATIKYYVGGTTVNGCLATSSVNIIVKTNQQCIPPVAKFTAPDTVCINTPVNITNTSTGASSYYWNFCVADIANQMPTGTNLGNVSGVLAQPVFVDLVYDADTKLYYGFLVNHLPGGLVRLDFGNSMLNTPTAVNLGNFGGALNTGAGSEGVQIVKLNGKWYGFVVGGYLPGSGTPRLVKIEFGTNLANPSPVATNWGNIGNLAQSIDLYFFQEGDNWFGLTVNATNNTITRFDFGINFDNPPTAVNLGNPGGVLDYPTGIHAINNNGQWHVFITNGNGSGSLARLDFGNSLLTTPIAVSLGNLNNTLHSPRDLTIMKFCDKIIGFLVNGNTAYNDIVRFDFNNDLLSVPSATSLGNIGTLNFPHSISKLFRVGDDLYTLITNVNNNTVTRIRFAGCTNASAPGSTAETPPPVTYNQPGIYNINLTIDEGLPSQTTFCKQVIVMAPPVHTPTRSVIRCPGQSKKIGTGTQPATYVWNTGATTDSIDVTQNGIYWVDISRFGCTTRDSIIVNSETADFSFEQDVCNPLSVKFTNETLNSVTAIWNFGNGYTATASPVNTTFTTYSDYTVQLSALTTSGCTVSITKQIPIHLLTDSLIITNDTTICYGTSKQLRALPALSYCWSPATSLSSTTIANPVTSTTSDIIYYLTSRMEGNNLIVNGDFSAGNTGFISDYKYVPPPSVLEGEYYVGNNSQSWNMYLSNCRDHTTANGNMLLVNGAAALDIKIWQQTVSVVPNTNYAFSTWIESISPTSPARLQFSINGQTIGNVISASLPVCNWSQFYTVWNSGNNTTAVIAIVNKNNAITGNDFALDDISFAPVIIKRDSVVIKVEKPALTINKDTTICTGINLPLQVTGAATYSWSPLTGLSAGNISNPVATPAATTKYYVTGTTINGCVAKDSVLVSVNPKPVITKTRDTLACDNAPLQLFATGGTTYQWTPALNLNNPNIANPVVTTITNTKYKVLVTDFNNCSNIDSVQVTVRARPVFTGPRDTTVCAGSPVTLHATGGDAYTWSPQSDISNPAIQNPVVTPPVTTQYDVYISENTCHYNATLKALITVNPKPGISYKDTVPACKALQLLAQPNGHPVTITNWAWEFGDGTGFNNAVDITHSYEQAGTYKVMLYATDANGCKDTAGKSIRIDTVTARASAALSLTCPGSQVMLTATGGTIYHWTPARFLNNSSIATPIAILDSTRRLQVTVSNEIGCRDTASVLVNVLQRPTFIKPPDQDVCVGNSVQLTHSNTPGYDYQWSPATYLDDPTRRIPVSSPLTNITYSLYVHEPLCSYDTTFNVVVNARPAPAVVAQKANDIDCMITLAPLTATGAQSYIWSPATHLDYPNRSNPVAAIDSTTKFYVTGTDAYGCSAIDSVIVKVSATGIPVFSIPNAFTPNNDGKNDCFGIRRWGNVKVKEFSIFNRWGQKVFSTTSPSGCWDGTFNGVPQATGGYVYVITAESFCGPIKRTGTVMLIR